MSGAAASADAVISAQQAWATAKAENTKLKSPVQALQKDLENRKIRDAAFIVKVDKMRKQCKAQAEKIAQQELEMARQNSEIKTMKKAMHAMSKKYETSIRELDFNWKRSPTK